MKKALNLSFLILAASISSYAQTTVTKTVTGNKDTVYSYLTPEVVTIQKASVRTEVHNYKTPATSGGTTTPAGGGTTTPPDTGSPGTGSFTVVSGPIKAVSGKTYANLLIDLKGAATTGIDVSGATGVHIMNCKIMNGTGFGINIYNSSNITVDNCFITNIGFAVYAYQSQSVKVNNNQFLNINGINKSSLGHAIQFNVVTGGGNQINKNRIENIDGVAKAPHDQINVFKSSGLVGDSIQVIGNWIRGGQRTAVWPGYTGAGIIMNDEGGKYQVCRNNICVRSGCNGIQSNTFSDPAGSVSIDHNICFNDLVYPVAGNGINILGAHTATVVSYNRINWINAKGNNVNNPDGETNIYFGNPGGTHTGTTLVNNVYNDKTLTYASILPAVIITMK